MNIVKLEDNRYIDDIMKIEHESFSIPWSRNSFLQEFTKDIAHYLGVLCGEELIAYAGFWKIEDEAHITNIAVGLDFRRKGIGKYLLNALIEYCKDLDINRATLEVRESNAFAISLYSSFGFEVDGIRKSYYEDNNEDALIMWKEI